MGQEVSGAMKLREDDMLVRLAVDDARTAQDAGAGFARALAGAYPVDFMVALAEQEDLVRRAILEAGFTAEQARLAAEHFEVAALAEWKRVALTATTDAWGTA